MAKSYPSTSSQVQGIVKAPSEKKKKWERKKKQVVSSGHGRIVSIA